MTATPATESSGSGEGWERRVVTGVQPTGALHVGNYFGAVRRCVRLQDEGEDLTVFIADLHSLTTKQVTFYLRLDFLPMYSTSLSHVFINIIIN